MSTLDNKARTQIPRVKMPELDPAFRVTSLTDEVNQGLSREQAVLEAQRCLNCPNPSCVTGCPVGINIPGFIKRIEAEDFDGALSILRQTSALPAVCGRVCPQEKQCESKCIYNKMHKDPVAIGYLERFAADNGNAVGSGQRTEDSVPCPTAHCPLPTAHSKIAVAGSGPAGLSFAGAMAALGYDVTVFEALHELGGVLIYGIPEFRLPNSVVEKEISALKSAGVKFEKGTVIGKTLSYDDLLSMGFRGLFVASGAGLPRFMNIPGENLVNVLSSNEYLTRINLMHAGTPGYATPIYRGKNVAVIGGGNTAMDSCRTARRMGAERVMVVYRRSENEMPARVEEVKHAKEEGVEFLTLHNPIEYLGDDRGHVSAMRLQRMALGEPDADGRRSPVAIEGDIVEIPVDQVIVSIGVSPNPLIPANIDGLEVTNRGTIAADAQTLQTSMADIFAGGDIVRGGATVILAMGDGRRAAAEMHKHLSL
ncbi:MAG: NADPH-dependent glutamate synthase [Bacteroides sp.]|nr:NADPH-dependent glutamate synthase [Bacteroides sp.]MCM1379826.1 NADPH-dependent glutamate synthase [Bacteroides sp.]MCM1446185.1 NADPH-dependent glutamate synthase [Prevotella sp.]